MSEPNTTLRSDLIEQLRSALAQLESPSREDPVCFDVFETEFEFDQDRLNEPHVVLNLF